MHSSAFIQSIECVNIWMIRCIDAWMKKPNNFMCEFFSDLCFLYALKDQCFAIFTSVNSINKGSIDSQLWTYKEMIRWSDHPIRNGNQIWESNLNFDQLPTRNFFKIIHWIIRLIVNNCVNYFVYCKQLKKLLWVIKKQHQNAIQFVQKK